MSHQRFQHFEFRHFNAVYFLTLSKTSPGFLRVCRTSLLKTLGKGEITPYEQFLLFPLCFLPAWITFYHFHQI